MKRMTTVIAAALAVMAFASIAFADGNVRAERRQVRQHVRIHQGVKSGALTRHEAKRLRQGQAHIRHLKLRSRADGVVTRREKARVERAQDRQSRAIRRLQHNGRRR